MALATVTGETTRAQIGGKICTTTRKRNRMIFCKRFPCEFFGAIEAVPSIVFHAPQPFLLSMASLTSIFSRSSYGPSSAVSLFLAVLFTPAFRLQPIRFLAALASAPSSYCFSTAIFFIALAYFTPFFWVINFFPSCKDTLVMASVISLRTGTPLFTEAHAY